MPAGAKPLKHGIVPVIGPPGMGKSYLSIYLIADHVLREQRPVFTNVPVVLKSLRAWLYMNAKGTKQYRRAVARLVRPMTQQHFTRFAERMEWVNTRAGEIMDGLKTGGTLQADAEFSEHEARTQANAEAEAKDPAKYSGAGANMVPPGSVLILDELHHWYPSRDYRNEPSSIMHLTSMHRHYMLRMYVMSQRLMNISLTFRAMASDYVFCLNLSKLPILGALRLERWISWFLYSWYDGTSVSVDKGQVEPGAKPYRRDYKLPELNNRQVFRVYRSYSHAGSIEELHEQLHQARVAMIGEEAETLRKKKGDTMTLGTRQNPRGIRLFLNRVLWIIVLGTIFWWMGRCSMRDVQAQQDAEAQAELVEEQVGEEEEEPDQAAINSTAERLETEQRERFLSSTLTAVLPGRVNIGRQQIQLGAQHEGFTLLAIDFSNGESIWIDNSGGVYRWTVGGMPTRGTLPEPLRAELRRVLTDAATSGAAPDRVQADDDDTP